ncbi:hypothetical protein [Streptomyces sp. NBC_00211]|uniref:hypothetical protein n=1 Tax=Streptomyces sp. NBC_00211 TaxID=2975683 RepID=UPI00324B5661
MTAFGDVHDESERLSGDELAALQLKRLRATLSRVYERVPHYRQAFDKAGVHPDDFRSLADLSLFPFTTKADLRDQYPFGMFAVPRSEVMGPGVAQECVETKDGLHIWEDHFYPEVVDPFTGEVLPEGESGELVFTSLTKEAMPIIRYRARDLTRLLPGTARPAFRRMEKVTGRSDDMIILRGVNLYPTQIEEILLRTPGLAPHFQLRLTREGRMDALTVRVEARREADPDQRRAAAAAVVRAVKEGAGVSVAVEVVDPETLERSVGKIKRMVDLRGAQ